MEGSFVLPMKEGTINSTYYDLNKVRDSINQS